MSCLPVGALDSQAAVEQGLDALLGQGLALPAALRVLRQLVLERLAQRDTSGQASLAEVMGTMTALAELALQRALAAAQSELAPRHGWPRTDEGSDNGFWIVGMGKLGARELNVSSDIDLIYLYEAAGESNGADALDMPGYSAALAKRLYALIGEVTDDGFVFRMDLALRPHGASGPPAMSLAALETYLLTHGREWERLAWLKSRVIAPHSAVTSGRALALSGLVTPFVYRKYLDYGVFAALRELHRQLRQQAVRHAAGRPQRDDDVKLGRGGIREIEFIVQLLQVVRGGQDPHLRTRSTVRGLQRLAQANLLSATTADALTAAYVWMRQVEHRIQYLDDQQTHQLPTDAADLDWIAATLAPPLANGQALRQAWQAHREVVAREFDALLHDAHATPDGAAVPADAPQWLAASTDVQQQLEDLLASPRVASLRDDRRVRLHAVLARAGATPQVSAQALTHLLEWLPLLLRRDNYLALLHERPVVLERLLGLLGLARWPVRYLMQHPGVIDELADERLLGERFDAIALTFRLQERHAAWVRAGETDEGELLDTLRLVHQAEVFRTLVRDVSGRLSVEQVADDLSFLADTLLACAIDWAWSAFGKRHREVPQLAIVAYGKLGGLELGYGGDLDVVFVYDESHEDDPQEAQDVYLRFIRQLMPWLTLRTQAGGLYEIDTALRPNGNSGLLVTSIASFENYQRGRGSNTAWTWEHQAITRARVACGPQALRERFEAVRQDVICAPRDARALALEIQTMRERVAQAHPVPATAFDVKHSRGGMMDAEFAIQYLVLLHGRDHESMRRNIGNTALMERAEAAGLLAADIGHAAAVAYRSLRRAQHRARLDERSTRFAPDDFAAERKAIEQLWANAFAAT